MDFITNRRLISYLLAFLFLLTSLFSASSARAVCSPTGHQRVLVISMSFQNDPGQVVSNTTLYNQFFASSGTSLATYWNELSYGRLTISGDVVGHYVIPINGPISSFSQFTDAVYSRAMNDVDITSYDRVFIINNDTDSTSTNIGLNISANSIGCLDVALPDGTIHNMTHSTINYIASDTSNINRLMYFYGHEGGHNLGLGHANYIDFGSESIGPIGGYNYQYIFYYGNHYDMMGGRYIPTHYTALAKHRLGWLTNSDIAKIKNNQTVDIEPLSTPLTGIKAARIFRGVSTARYSFLNPDSLSKEYYWVETRQPVGYDANIQQGAISPQDAYGTALINWVTGTVNPATETVLLDMNPSPSRDQIDSYDAGLQPYSTFTDPYTGLIITQRPFSSNMRLTVTYPVNRLDQDEDGIPDVQEATYGTLVNNADSDGDGLTDLWEICFDGNCNNYNPGEDLNPNLPDTDGDGINDREEVLNPPYPVIDGVYANFQTITQPIYQGDFIVVLGSGFCEEQCDTSNSSETTVVLHSLSGTVTITNALIRENIITFNLPYGMTPDFYFVHVDKNGLGDLSPEAFTVLADTPAITSLTTENNVPLDQLSVGDTLYIHGTQLCQINCNIPNTVAVISVNGLGVTPVSVTRTLMTVTIPPHFNGVSGPVIVHVTRSDGSHIRSEPSEQSIAVPANQQPVITGFSFNNDSPKTYSVGDLVMVSGWDLCGDYCGYFEYQLPNGINPDVDIRVGNVIIEPYFTSASADFIVFLVPPSMTTGYVEVITPFGTAVSPETITIE